MKKLLTILMFGLFSISAFGGVVRFSAKHVVKPVVKVVSYPVLHPVKSVKASANVAKKVVY